MICERALKIVLLFSRIALLCGSISRVGGLLDPANSDTGDTMQRAIYAALGVFLLMAMRNPAEHRSLTAFVAWSSLAHAVVMSVLGTEIPSHRTGFSSAPLCCW